MNATNFSLPDCNGLNCISQVEKIIFGCLSGGIIFIGLLGNFFVIWSIFSDSKFRRAVMNIMLLNLALADFGNLMSCSTDLIQILNDQGWIYPDFFCPLIRYCQVVFLYGSLMTQIGVSIERYMAICSPFQVSRVSRKKVKMMISVSWVASSLFALPYALHRCAVVDPIHLVRVCSMLPEWRGFVRGFKYAEFLFLYLIPLIMMLVLYVQTGRALWGRASTRELYRHQLTKYLAILRRRRSVIKMLALCVAIYFLCYSPLQILFILGHFVELRVPMTIRLVLNAVTLASSAANPVVYTICYDQFRHKLLKLLKLEKESKHIENIVELSKQTSCNRNTESSISKQRSSEIESGMIQLEICPAADSGSSSNVGSLTPRMASFRRTATRSSNPNKIVCDVLL